MKLQQMQVKMLPNSKVCKFTEEGIVLEDETLVPCNCAVFAVGFASNDSHLLVEECEKRQIPCRVIGDANPQDVLWMRSRKDLKRQEHCRNIGG